MASSTIAACRPSSWRAAARAWSGVAALLWLGDLDAALPAAAPAAPGGLPWALPDLAGLVRSVRQLRPLERLQVLLPVASASDQRAYDLRPTAALQSGVRLLALLAAAAAGIESEKKWRPERGAAATLARAWAPRVGGATRLIDAALALSADHELNVSAFTARCVASAGAPPQAAVVAGLAALGGPRHGGYCDRLEAFLLEVGVPASPAPAAPSRRALRERVAARLRRGEEIPAYGHPLYPQGDPRGALLMRLAAESCPGSPTVEAAHQVAEVVFELIGERPTLDFGLVTAAQALGLPAGAALGLFAVGRSVGWVAHSLEQYADGRLIRPRARYLGPRRAPAEQIEIS